MELRAIETAYHDCLFRSRIEARWAVFFDYLKIAWEYEAEGFELPYGRYLPDFWLTDHRWWFEVKGALPVAEKDRNRCVDLAKATGQRVFIARGKIEKPTWERASSISEVFPSGGYSGYYWWASCAECGMMVLKFYVETDSGGGQCPRCGKYIDAGEPCGQVGYAVRAANSARFEHGETA
jgi:hypothetical protein